MTRWLAASRAACKNLLGFFTFTGIFALSLHAPALAKEKKISPALNFIDTGHSAISKRILGLSNKIDSFFGDPRIDEEANNTRLRLFTVTSFKESQTPETEAAYKFQLRLPKTEKRLQLIVQSDEDEDEPGATSLPNQEKTNGARENLDDSPSAALRYLLDVADINFSTDAGVRVHQWPPQVFGRARFRKNITFGKWLFRPVEKLLWVDREGWYSRTDLNFDYRINDMWLFRYVNKINWDDQDYVVRYQNGPTWYQKISDRVGISYGALNYWEDTPGWAVNTYTFSIGFRQLLYKEWFFWEIAPYLAFSREAKFRREPGAAIRFEAILGRI